VLGILGLERALRKSDLDRGHHKDWSRRR
jgi:hypothetical protein